MAGKSEMHIPQLFASMQVTLAEIEESGVLDHTHVHGTLCRPAQPGAEHEVEATPLEADSTHGRAQEDCTRDSLPPSPVRGVQARRPRCHITIIPPADYVKYVCSRV